MNPELTLADYLQTFRRRWVLIVVVSCLAIAAAVAYSLLATPVYESTATVLLRTTSTDPLFPPVGTSQRNNFIREPVAESEYANTSEFRTLANLNAPAGPTVTIIADDDARPTFRSPVLQFVATGGDPETTRAAAQSWADTYLSTRATSDVDELDNAIDSLGLQIDLLEAEKAEISAPLRPIDNALLSETNSDAITRLTAQRLAIQDTLEDQLLPITLELRSLTSELSRLRITQTFVAIDGISAREGRVALAGRQIAPNPVRNVALAAATGLLLALALAALLESLRTGIADRKDVERLLGDGSVLAEVPILGGSPRHPDGPGADQYRAEIERVVSSVVAAIESTEDGARFLITSSRPSEGKTTLSYEIATRLGLGMFRTVLIDADLRRPTLHGYFGLANRRAGLSDVLSAEGARPKIRSVEIEGNEELRFLPAGTPTEDSSRLLRSGLADVLDRVSSDVSIIIDSPPTLALPDAEVIAGQTDWVIIVARIGESSRSDLATTAQRIEASRSELLGVVLMGAPVINGGYSYYAINERAQRAANRAAIDLTDEDNRPRPRGAEHDMFAASEAPRRRWLRRTDASNGVEHN